MCSSECGKTARKDRNRRYCEENREAVAERNRRYREENCEAVREYQLRYYEENREAIAESNRANRRRLNLLSSTILAQYEEL